MCFITINEQQRLFEYLLKGSVIVTYLHKSVLNPGSWPQMADENNGFSAGTCYFYPNLKLSIKQTKSLKLYF